MSTANQWPKREGPFVPREITLDDFMEAEHNAAELARVAAEAEHLEVSLRETGKDLLASIMGELEKNAPQKISEQKLERVARTSDQWLKFREGYYAALNKKLGTEVEARSAERIWMTYQSIISYRKEEFKKL